MDTNSLPYLDILIGIILAYSCYKGWFGGFIKEVMSLGGLLVAAYGCIHFSHYVEKITQNYFSVPDSYANIIFSVVTFLLIFLVINILASLLSKLVAVLSLGLFNRILGMFFSLVKITMILALFVWQFEKVNRAFNLVSQDELKKSLLYTSILEVSIAVIPWLSANSTPSIEKIFDS